MNWRIVEAAPDVATIMPVMDAAFPACYGEGWSRAQTAGMLASPHMRSWLAREEGDGVLGFALARQIVDEAELLMLAVLPAARRRGVGAALLDTVCDHVRAHGAHSVFLEMREGNSAEALYKKRGFAPIGRRADYYRNRDGGRFDAITYALSLLPGQA